MTVQLLSGTTGPVPMEAVLLTVPTHSAELEPVVQAAYTPCETISGMKPAIPINSQINPLRAL